MSEEHESSVINLDIPETGIIKPQPIPPHKPNDTVTNSKNTESTEENNPEPEVNTEHEIISALPTNQKHPNEEIELLAGGGNEDKSQSDSIPDSIPESESNLEAESNPESESTLETVESNPESLEPEVEEDEINEAEVEDEVKDDAELVSELDSEDLQVGGGSMMPEMDIQFTLEYLMPEDEQLIHKDHIIRQVRQYIENYYSNEFTSYKKSFNNLYQKYSNKRYIIENVGKFITVFKTKQSKDLKEGVNIEKNIHRGEIVMELKKPEYLFYNENNNLDIMKTDISNFRSNLQYHYQKLVNKLEVLNEEKATFEKQRKKFIQLLETYYIYKLYDKYINNKHDTDTVNIIFEDLFEYNKDNLEKQTILQGNLYYVDKTLVNNMNNENSIKLNEYNELIGKIQATKNIKENKELNEAIKKYLDKTNVNKLDSEIKLYVKKQENYINFIITKLPI